MDKDADGLSRNPMSIEESEKWCTKEINTENVKILMTSPKEIACSGISIKEWVEKIRVKRIENVDLIEKQKGDSVVGPVYKAVAIGTRPKKRSMGEVRSEVKSSFTTIFETENYRGWDIEEEN